ncbi:MAG TPA: helix-turn-helix domain-containing protein [Streptosporangiaceae bacterium]|nr:helix-turn-helix domain-containing protein [Streptosporangiaceae bacterium]
MDNRSVESRRRPAEAEAPSRARRVSRQKEAGEVTRRETRRRLLEAANAEFAERGYAAATVIRIADRADVSVQSLYSNWGNKRNLLRAIMEHAVTADEDVPLVPGQPPPRFQAALDAGVAADPRRLLAALSHEFRLLAERAAVGWQTYRDGAAIDPDIAADWRELNDIRRQSLHGFFSRVPAEVFRPGMTQAAAADAVWVIASPDTRDLLVRQAGYSYDQFEEWVRTTITAALLPDSR